MAKQYLYGENGKKGVLYFMCSLCDFYEYSALCLVMGADHRDVAFKDHGHSASTWQQEEWLLKQTSK